jgi:hypothetical protein
MLDLSPRDGVYTLSARPSPGAFGLPASPPRRRSTPTQTRFPALSVATSTSIALATASPAGFVPATWMGPRTSGSAISMATI